MPFLRLWIISAVIIMGFIPVRAQIIPLYQENPCPFDITTEGEIEGETIICGTLFVPENRLRADIEVPTLELAVVLIRSTGANPMPDPIIYLEGGPGGSAIAYYDIWFESAFREQRDIILIDQRGTGFSQPSLNCPEYDDYELENPVEVCRERLKSEGINLNAYNSRENAADIADLIVALNLEQANLFGVSYGTRLALTVLRDFPDRIRTVILDAVYPPQVNRLDEQPKNGNRAFEVLFAACAADMACNTAYPNLREMFYQTVAQLNEEPLLLPDTTTGEEYELNGIGLADAIFNDLYDADLISFLPAKIKAAHQRDALRYLYYGVPLPEQPLDTQNINFATMTDEEFFGLWAEFLGYETTEALDSYLMALSDAEYYMQQTALIMVFTEGAIYRQGIIDDNAEGMYASIECAEDIPFNSMLRVRLQARDIPEVLRKALLTGVEYAFAECYYWEISEAAPLENEPVYSEVPALIFSGEYDPITPPAWGDAAAATLPNSYHFVLPGVGHGAVDRFACPTQISLDFLIKSDTNTGYNLYYGDVCPDFLYPESLKTLQSLKLNAIYFVR